MSVSNHVFGYGVTFAESAKRQRIDTHFCDPLTRAWAPRGLASGRLVAAAVDRDRVHLEQRRGPRARGRQGGEGLTPHGDAAVVDRGAAARRGDDAVGHRELRGPPLVVDEHVHVHVAAAAGRVAVHGVERSRQRRRCSRDGEIARRLQLGCEQHAGEDEDEDGGRRGEQRGVRMSLGDSDVSFHGEHSNSRGHATSRTVGFRQASAAKWQARGLACSGKRTLGKDSTTVTATRDGMGAAVPEYPALTMRDSPVTP